MAGKGGPSSTTREATIGQKLLDPTLDVTAKLKVAIEMRDTVDRELDYAQFIAHCLPSIVSILNNGKISMLANSPEHRLRHTLLETLHRLQQPHADILKPHTTSLVQLLLGLLRTENEDNSCLAMKIIIELNRSFKDHLAPLVDSFLDMAKDVYSAMPSVVSDIFDAPEPEGAASPIKTPLDSDTPALQTPAPGKAESSPSQPVVLAHTMRSFKVMTETPIAVVFFFQSHKDLLQRELKNFVPLIFDVRAHTVDTLMRPQFLALQPRAQAELHKQEADADPASLPTLAPSLASKRAAFNDLLVAQVKTMSFLAYVLRVAQENLTAYKDVIPEVIVRMLKDIQPEATSNRKELLIAERHILATDFRTAFVPHIQALLDERVELGRGTTARETLVPLAYSTVADMIHHVRSQLAYPDLSRVIHVYSCKLFSPHLPPAIQTMCCKLLLNLIETIIQQDREAAAGLLGRINEAFVRKMEGMASTRNDWPRWLRAPKVKKTITAGDHIDDSTEMDDVDIARARPVASVAAICDSYTEPVKSTSAGDRFLTCPAMVEIRFKFKTLLFGCRSIISSIKHIGAMPPDAQLLGRLFRAATQCLVFYDSRREGRELKEVVEGLCDIFFKTDLLIFQEVFETNMPFYLDELLINHELLALPQHILMNEVVSQAFLGITFRFLVKQLDRIGNESKEFSGVVLRLFKMACMAVTIFPEANEQVLQPHLGKIIMDSLRLASQAKEPNSYYLLLRSLFRSIGGGRFEVLYKEVLPLLQTLLENLNGLIQSAERSRRDLFVELCLTVPVRLSVLLPYLTYLMRPLVFALQATPDLISQGLRTLELCVDNLTQEFLNPLLAPVRADVMAALWKLLRPVPFNHQHAHTTMRILGKIGGRNRKQLSLPRLEWKPVGDEALMPVEFDGERRGIRMAPLVELSVRMFKRGDAHYRQNAYNYLKHASVIFLRESLPSGECEDVFGQVIRGLFDATRVTEFAEEATGYLRDFCRYIFATELTRQLPEGGASKQAFPLSSTLIEAITEALASADDHLPHIADQITVILNDLLQFKATDTSETAPKTDMQIDDQPASPTKAKVTTGGGPIELPLVIMHQLASKISSLCYEQSWQRKTGGATGISILTRRLEPNQHGIDWVTKHESNFVRALLFMLKDMPGDPPGNVGEVQATLMHVFRLCNTLDAGTTKEAPEYAQRSKKLEYLITVIVQDLASQVTAVRETMQMAFRTLSEVTGLTLYELLRPARERLLGPIFAKPLRALAFSMQVGFIDALTYCITLEPPLIEFEFGVTQREQPRPPLDPVATHLEAQLLRVLGDALTIADTDDAQLGRNNTQHKNQQLLVQLRVVCVKLLSAALATSDPPAPAATAEPTPSDATQPAKDQAVVQLHPMRHKTLQVYFKLLYSRSPEVVDAVYECLKAMLQDQGKLPKELLQAGLRPVLLNLSDYKRLSVANLAGLARLLELLTNYFKVEIGNKLLDHFRNLANDLGGLAHTALNPHAEDGVLPVMYSLVNIFRLLPYPASDKFLPELLPLVVASESQLKRVGPSPFTKPLSGFLNRYPHDTVQFFAPLLETDEAYARTFLAVLDHAESTALRDFLGDEDHAKTLLLRLFAPDTRPPVKAPDGSLMPAQPAWKGALHGAKIMAVLATHDPAWLTRWTWPFETAITQRWVSKSRRDRLQRQDQAHLDQLAEDDAVLAIETRFLETAPMSEYISIDMLFHIVDVFAYQSPTDRAWLAAWFYQHVAASRDVVFKRKAIARFVDILGNASVTEEHKIAALRYIVNPMLMIAFSRGPAEQDVADSSFIHVLDARLWKESLKPGFMDTHCKTEALQIELCFMTSLLMKHRGAIIESTLGKDRGSVVKFAWVSARAEDPTVKNVAHALIGQCIAKMDSSPAKLVTSVFPALLKAHTSEARQLVRDSINELARALTENPARAGPLENGMPSWVRYMRKILLEEGHSNLAQVAHIYSTIARHPDLFYPYRASLVQHLTQTLSKIAVPPQSTSQKDERPLAADLLELVMVWERKRRDEAGPGEDAMETEAPAPRQASAAPSSTSGSSAYAIPAAQRDIIVHLALRLVATASEPAARPHSPASKYLQVFRDLIATAMWPDVTLKVGSFQRFALQGGQTEPTEQSMLVYCNTLEALHATLALRPDDWVATNLVALRAIVERGLNSLDARLHAAAKPVLLRMFTVVHALGDEEATTDDVRAFVDWAQTTITQNLGEGPSLTREAPPSSSSALAPSAPAGSSRAPPAPVAPPAPPDPALAKWSAALTMLHAWAAAASERVDQFVPAIVRNLTRLVKDHLTAPAPVPDADQGLQLIMSTLDILKTRMVSLGEHRRWVLSAAIMLVEKSSNVTLCRTLLGMARHWILEGKDAIPTVKEKAGVLVKMQAFEHRNDENLLKDFLQLILDVYTDPAFARTELTVRLESAFLLGCRSRDSTLRGQFLDLFDQAISRSLFTRMHYLIGVQSWEVLAESAWIHQAVDLLLGAVDAETVIFDGPDPVHAPIAPLVAQLRSFKTGGMIASARKLLYADATVAQATWISTFAAGWSCLSRKEHNDMSRFLVTLLTKEYHLRNVDRRPNNVQTLLGGVLACSPLPSMPPHLVRYLGKTFNAWHTSLEILQETADETGEDEIREMTFDAMAATYADLSEDDLFYGLWRRRCFYSETSIALSFEQNGMWQQAQQMHEAAQVKARTGGMPFTESEYAVWEDHWVMCAQKLQQWDILTDLAKHEGNAELLLECAWRLSDWEKERDTIELALKQMSPVPTPRRRVFEAYMALIRTAGSEEKTPFVRICDDGIQLALRKWFYLPEIVTDAHIPLLQVFQQFVELQEANQIYASLAQTNSNNLDQQSQQLKNILITWRERLPNEWDDINVWSDLVAWRQHIFSAINNVYLGITQSNPSNPTPGGQSSYAYRGYHETAWIINRFAHVARKHHLADVCITSLTKIYTLPNIEIQEAFLKLREQAKCHYQQPNELTTGLEVINNTNLGYFGPAQKAEFFTLKGMFLARLNLDEEARATFNQAISQEMTFPKAWAEWAQYHDRLFVRSGNTDLSIAANAVSCYLQAAGLYKSAKVRKLLVRILWLLSLDDVSATVAKAFELYKGEVPVWYWITFIPQLLLSLGHREAQYARIILIKIAKNFPQALYFLLRTSKEDLAQVKRNWTAQQERQLAASQAARALAQPVVSPSAGAGPGDVDSPAAAPTPASTATGVSTAAPAATTTTTTTIPPGMVMGPNGQLVAAPSHYRHPWEHVDEIVSVLKTAWPLMSLSLEYFCDAVTSRFKTSSDEDIWRLITALLNDALGQYALRAHDPDDDGALPVGTATNLARVAQSLHAGQFQVSFEEDFVTSKPNLAEYVQRLQKWRDRCESALDRKPKRLALESASHWLVEFQYNKFDELEVPGQYLLHEDSNNNFVRIASFKNKFDFARSAAACSRRLHIVGHDGTQHAFAIQLPASRYGRREERMHQFFRMLNWPLERRKESRKRNLGFYVPITVPLAPLVRLQQNDASIVTLQDIWEQHCRETGINKDDPVLMAVAKMAALVKATGKRLEPSSAAGQAARLEIFEEVGMKVFPDDILKRYMIRTMTSPADLWHVRKQMTVHMASFLFATYLFCIGGRNPGRIHISRSTGVLYTSDLLPSMAPREPEFAHSEPVPFRFTPNIQKFMTPVGAEGVLTSALLAIARGLTENETELEHRLCIFVREEINHWVQQIGPRAQASSAATAAGGQQQQPSASTTAMTRDEIKSHTLENVNKVVKRAQLLACRVEREKTPLASVPANQTIIELLSTATNVSALAQVDSLMLPWL